MHREEDRQREDPWRKREKCTACVRLNVREYWWTEKDGESDGKRKREREKGRERNINYCMSQSSKWRVFSGDVRFSRPFYYSLLARPAPSPGSSTIRTVSFGGGCCCSTPYPLQFDRQMLDQELPF